MKYAVFAFFLSAFFVMGCRGHHRSNRVVIINNDLVEIRVGDQVTGHVDGAGDIDWYAIELENGKEYRFCTSNLSAEMDTILRLVTPDGSTVLAENDNVGEDTLASCIEFCVDADGLYFLLVVHQDPEATTGMYDLSVELLGDCPPSNDCEGNGHYESGGSGHDGRHCSDEVDD